MSATRILLNVVGFFVMLDGCLGLTSPDVSKRLMLFFFEKLPTVIFRLASFLWGLAYGLILWGILYNATGEKGFLDYFLIIISTIFAVVYIGIAVRGPGKISESGFARQLTETPNSIYRIYGFGTTALGLFLVLVSVRY
jgi:uncharacterized protein YjeT (DUF2065 family)